MSSEFNTFTFKGKFKGWSKKPIPKRVNGEDQPPEWAYTFIIETDDGLTPPISIYRNNESRVEKIPMNELMYVGGHILERDGCMEFNAKKIASATYSAKEVKP